MWRFKVSKSIKIGFDAKRAYCNYRGLGSYSRLLIEGLIQLRRDCFKSVPLELFLMTPKITLENMLNWPFQLSDIESVYRVMPQGLLKIWPEFWRGYAQIKKWEELNLDIYHGLSHELPWSLKSHSKTKTVVTIHDLIFLRQPDLYPWWDRSVYIKKVQHSCRVADSIVAISEQAKRDLMELMQMPGEKIKVIYQAVHPRYGKNEKKSITENVQNQVPYFLFVGALEDRKNVLRLIQAFAEFNSKESGYQLVIVGKGRLEKSIHELISKLSLIDKVKLKTNVMPEDLPFLYQNSIAVVYPSLLEGFGLPIVEAMMSETLVLTSKGSCFPEAGGSSAFYADPLSIDDIKEKMLEVVSLSSVERQVRIHQGLNYVQKFHWKNAANELLLHYQSLLV